MNSYIIGFQSERIPKSEKWFSDKRCALTKRIRAPRGGPIAQTHRRNAKCLCLSINPTLPLTRPRSENSLSRSMGVRGRMRSLVRFLRKRLQTGTIILIRSQNSGHPLFSKPAAMRDALCRRICGWDCRVSISTGGWHSSRKRRARFSRLMLPLFLSTAPGASPIALKWQ